MKTTKMSNTKDKGRIRPIHTTMKIVEKNKRWLNL